MAANRTILMLPTPLPLALVGDKAVELNFDGAGIRFRRDTQLPQ